MKRTNNKRNEGERRKKNEEKKEVEKESERQKNSPLHCIISPNNIKSYDMI